MTRLLRALRPTHGNGTWAYDCPATISGHRCELGRHGGKHRSSIGFEWGKA